MSEKLITFFKALADTNRLKIVGLLAGKPYSVEELAALLKLKPSTVSHHLARLSEAGLVRARAESYYSVYQLDQSVLEAKARSMFTQEELSSVAAEVDVDAYDRSEEHTSELQSQSNLVCRLLLEKKKQKQKAKS